VNGGLGKGGVAYEVTDMFVVILRGRENEGCFWGELDTYSSRTIDVFLAQIWALGTMPSMKL